MIGNFTREATRQELINKINEMQKEIENLKEINKEHQKLNGELREEKYIEGNFISKDKIREKIKELDNQQKQWLEDRENKASDIEIIYARDVLQELLEEE